LKSFKQAGDHRIAFRFLLSYLIILCLPLMIGVIIYDRTVNVIEAEVMHTNKTVLNQSMKTLDGKLAFIEENARNMAQNSKVNSFQFLQDAYTGSNTYRILDTRGGLNEYALTNDFILGYYILFSNSDLALSAKETYRLPEFYQDTLHYNDMNYADWKQEFLVKYRKQYLPAEAAVFRGKSYEVVTYIHSLGNPSYHQGTVMVLLDNNKIKNLLSGLNLSGGGWAYIADNTGQIVSYLSASGEVHALPSGLALNKGTGVIQPSDETNQMMVTYTSSDQNGWTYVAVQSPDIVLMKVNYIKQFYYWVASIMLLLGCLIALALAYRSSKPVRKLISNNEELEARISEQQPIIRAVFFERLLKGDFKSEEDLKMLMQHVGIFIHGSRYLVAVVHLSGYRDTITKHILEELDAGRVLVKDMLRNIMDVSDYMHDVGEDKIALLLTVDGRGESAASLNFKIERIAGQITELSQRTGIAKDYSPPDPKLAIGGICDDLQGISASYNEALQTLNYFGIQSQRKVLWHREMPKESNSYYYPAEVENKLINLAKAGDWDHAAPLLTDLYQCNFQERNLALPMLRLFIQVMWGSVVKIVEQLALTEEKELSLFHTRIGQLDAMENPQEGYPAIVEIIGNICLVVNSRKKSHNEQLKQNVQAYIHAHFHNPELTLDMVADHFQISMKYLSQFYKEQVGVGFSEYVNTLRMEEAKRLLLQTSLSVNEISQRVGYYSSNVFCRAFKRIFGMPPNTYRSSLA